MGSFTLLAENEINTLLFHLIPFISFVSNLDTTHTPWNERGSALNQLQFFLGVWNVSVVFILKFSTAFLFVKRWRFEFFFGAYHSFVMFYTFVKVLVKNHEVDFFTLRSLLFSLQT